ncbi:hypothetical protein EDF70_10182 [Neorhizobium sp. JUb45]|nr:hypothetical protein EDF70_10182 [Neorhizobium sp. JUb45]
MSDNRTVVSASTFVNSIGINTKGSTYSDGYKNSSLIVESLEYLGVNKVRDSFAEHGKASPVVDAMADAGIQFDFRVTYTLPGKGDDGIEGHITGLKAFMAKHPGSVIAVEGVNEANVNSVTYNGMVGLDAAIAFQKALYTAIRAEPELNGVTVINLSLAYDNLADYAKLGDLGDYSDAANAHTYTHTGKDADSQVEYTLDLAKGASVGDRLIVTETGHTTLKSEPGIGTSETAQAKLLLSDLLLSYENGASETYIYELFDNEASRDRGEKEVYFGLFEQDGTPKEAAIALHNLTTILGFGDDGTADGIIDVDYTLAGAPADTHSMLMEKSGGVYDLVVWRDALVFDDITDTDITNPPTTVTINLGRTESIIRVYDPMQGLTPIAVYQNVSSFTIPLSDSPLIIEVGAPEAVHEPVTTVDADLSMTAAEFVSQMHKLDDAQGLQTVTLTDGNVLAVSSVETMAYMIANYGALLAKVQGGFSFTVTYGEAQWTKVQEFDAAGNLTLTTDYGIDGGIPVSKINYYTDGTHETWNYHITGQDYATIHQKFDTNGNITLLERLNADGSFNYREIRSADGTKEYMYYNAAGKLVNDVTVTTDGTNTTLTYDPATGNLITKMVKEADGDIFTTQYTNGVRTVYAVTSHEGWKQQITYDATTGQMLTDYVLQSDGSASNKTYVGGVLMKLNTKNADGTYDNWSYNIKGQAYETIHQKNDAAGNITLIERLRADGTHEYREVRAADGSKEFFYYNTAGKLVTDVQVASDGTSTTFTYNPATEQVISKVVKETDGDVFTSQYTNGVRTLYAVTSHEGWKQQITYDAKTGVILVDYKLNADGSATNKTYVGGVLTKMNSQNADGTYDSWNYNITGQTYVTIHQKSDANGNVTLIERLHADGTYDYREIRTVDGAKQYLYYDTAGRVVNDVQVAADGTNTTFKYDPSSGSVISKMVKEPDGDLFTSTYVNGVRTLYVATSHEGWKQTITYDAKTGIMLTDYIANADGSATNKTYVSGVLTKVNTQNVDGTLDNWTYNITGQTYATVHQKNDAAGNILLIERLHTNGTYDYREVRSTDGSRDYMYYDSVGRLQNDVTVAADGTNTTLKYDVASGHVITKMVKEPDGDLFTTSYTDGIRTGYNYVGHLGDKHTTTYDKAGVMLTDYVLHTDGSATNKTYVGGELMKQNILNADGTMDNWAYNVTGKTYVTEHQSTDAAGKVLLIARFHEDGSYDYKEQRFADGSKDISTYDAKGTLLYNSEIEADGSRIVHAYKQDGTGQVWSDHMSASGTILSRDISHADGRHDLYAYANGQTLDGGAGNDTFYFRTTSDGKMLYEGGKDTVFNFNNDASGPDYIDIDSNWAATFDDLNMTQQGTDVLIEFNDQNSILIKQSTIAALQQHHDYFVFS